MKVVDADLSHVEYLSDFGSRSFIHAYQCTLPLEELRKYINIAFSESVISEEINNRSISYFICQNSNLNPCGYAKLIQSPKPQCINSNSCIELQRLYVDSAYRGQGAGKLLVSYAEFYSTHRNINNIWLRVWENNVVAQEIYKKWSFVIVGKELYTVGKDQRIVLLMRKVLKK